MRLKGLFLTLALVVAGAAGWQAVAQEQIVLSEGWTLQKSGETAVFKASVPSTVMGVLTANGLYGDLLIGTNYRNADRTPFDSSWWYRTEFDLADLKGKYITLNLEGLSYRANVWLNGTQIASKDDTFGVFCRWEFDVTEIVRENNKLEVEIFRAQPGEPNIGFVDWNPRPLDESMGLVRPVVVEVTGAVDVKNAFARSDVNTETLTEAALTVEADVVNRSGKRVKGILKGRIENIAFEKEITLAAGESRNVRFTPEEVAGLNIKNPRLWWSVGLGEPELYELQMEFVVKNKVSDSEQTAFGIREIDTYFTEDGYKGFMLNGKKVLIKGAGWTDEIFLRDTDATNERQVRQVKDMNMNAIRFENIWGKTDNIYDLCDKYGILALVGWSCQWEWEGYLGAPEDEFMSIRTPEDIALVTRYFHDQVLRLRNHPAIIAWYGGSDKLMRPELEQNHMAILAEFDPTRPLVGSAQALTSEVTGPSGMKMRGPYDYVGPNYWFSDTRNGGAYGFNTETGPGAQLATIESIKRFIPADEMWPMGPSWDFHCTTSGNMNSLDVMTEVLTAKYGEATSVEDYLRKADQVSYESTKSMFEAFRVNKQKATGVIQWMLNSAWPCLYWQLYDYYGVPTASYYAVQKANTPFQLVYNYDDNGIYLVNEQAEGKSGLTATVKVFCPHSRLVSEQAVTELVSEANSSKKIAEIDPTVEKNVFVSLSLLDQNGGRIAENFYALSAQHDVYNYASNRWYVTPISDYADFTAIADMPAVTLEVNSAATGNKMIVELTNTSDVIAFSTVLKLKGRNGGVITPVFWSDNYLNLLPGETRVVECSGDISLAGAQVEVSGWNVK